MQTDLARALQAQARLAALGEAVAKINHDLRNMLTSAQMASERLAALGDPQVAQALPRLERAWTGPCTLASDVLAYGKSRGARLEPCAPLPCAPPGRGRRGRRPALAGVALETGDRRPRAGDRRPGPVAPHPDQPAAQRPRGHRGRA